MQRRGQDKPIACGVEEEMKKVIAFGGISLCCAISLGQFGCSSSADHSTPTGNTDTKTDELIGSVPVNSASLDGIGTLGLVYSYSYPTGGFGGDIGIGGSGGGFTAGSGGFTAGSGGTGPIPTDPTAGSGGAVFLTAGSGGSLGCDVGCQPSFYPQCTGTLISKNSVLTSRSCAGLLNQVYDSSVSLKFAIGPDSTQPRRLIDVVAVDYAPAITVDGNVTFPDLAVVHLAESVTDVAAFPVSPLTDDLIGKPLASVGFGNVDRSYQSGTRRAGTVTLRATQGLLYPLIFATFEDFYQFSVGGSGGGFGGSGPVFIEAASAGGPSGGMGNAGDNSIPAGGGGFTAGSSSVGGGFTAGFGGSSSNDWYRQYLQQQYDSVALAPGESFFGGSIDDAQPCGIDQGGPVVRKLNGKVRVFGVFSHNPFYTCEKGAVYASVTADNLAFITQAAQWKDPCENLSVYGKCVGNVAERCSTVLEGARRAVKFDCNLLNQVCVGGNSTEVACTDR